MFFDEKYGFWNVTRHEDILSVLRNEECFSNRSAIPMPLPPEDLRDRMPVYPFETALLFKDDPDHRRNRLMVQAPFVPRRLREREPRIRQRADELIGAALPSGRMDFLAEFALPLALTVIGDLVGVPEEDWPMLERAVTGAFQIATIESGLVPDGDVRPLAEEQADYWQYLCELAEERRRRPTDDFSSVIAGEVNPDDGSSLSAAEIAGLINTMLGAGFHTSAQLMTSAVHAILGHRDQWELLKSDRSLLPGAVEECARYRSSVKRIFRLATTDVEIGGVTVPEGGLVALVLASANRDESVYGDAADRFDITRGGTNLTFGRGMHHCLGASLTKTELRITLETLLDRAPDARLADQDLVRPPDVRLDTLESLHLELV